MNFWNRLADRERAYESGGRPYIANGLIEKTVAVHLDHIQEVKLPSGKHVFRIGDWEYSDLEAARSHLERSLLHEDRENSDSLSLEGETRERTKEECRADISGILAGLEDELVSKLAAVLQRDGDWRKVLITSNDNKRELNEDAGRKDLYARLVEVFGNDWNLFLLSIVKPDILKKAIGLLPPGETEKDITRKLEKVDDEVRKNQAKRIQEVKVFLKNANSPPLAEGIIFWRFHMSETKIDG